ncbi:MAG: COG4280 domain-containing protein [Symploca sp. SIO2B6]|nr:COG4280 domain-containing protein [Symploca sp. SIO2B6]
MNWSVALATGGSASLDFLETAAIAYAIARSGYRREAIAGCISGLMIVTLVAIALGANVQFIPLHWLQIVTGLILLRFGWIWTKKAVKRQATGQRAGWINDDPLVAEGISLDSAQQGFSRLNFIVMTKSATLEAFEVAVIVITLGLASDAWVEALGATGIALVGSITLVVALHPYLVNVPDVFIKLGAGVLLSSLGTFWLGEGLGFDWPFGDWAILGLIGLYALTAYISINILRKPADIPIEPNSAKVSQ